MSSSSCSVTNYKDCLKVVLYDKIEHQLVPKLLLQVSVIELQTSLVSDPNDGDVLPMYTDNV